MDKKTWNEYDKKYFKKENTGSMMIESYISTLQFYGNIDRRVTKIEIQLIKQVKENLKLPNDFENKNRIELADCYFHTGEEHKARKLMLKFIKNNPDEDEAYMCMQNWYMYDKPNINKLAEVIDLSERNSHVLFTDYVFIAFLMYSSNFFSNKTKLQHLLIKFSFKCPFLYIF